MWIELNRRLYFLVFIHLKYSKGEQYSILDGSMPTANLFWLFMVVFQMSFQIFPFGCGIDTDMALVSLFPIVILVVGL